MNLKQMVFLLVLVSIVVGFLANSVLMRLFGYVDSDLFFPAATLALSIMLLAIVIKRLKKKLRI